MKRQQWELTLGRELKLGQPLLTETTADPGPRVAAAPVVTGRQWWLKERDCPKAFGGVVLQPEQVTGNPTPDHVEIYALEDPWSGCLCYVGQTIWTPSRVAEHCNEALGYVYSRALVDQAPEAWTHKQRWLGDLLANGHGPKVRVLEVLFGRSRKEADELGNCAEILWVERLRPAFNGPVRAVRAREAW